MLTDTWWMTHRQLKALLRQPAVVVITLVQPMVWLFLFGNLFRRVVELPGFGSGSYLDYLVPGVVVMNAVSSNMWAGMGTIEEIERGTMNRFLTIAGQPRSDHERERRDRAGDHHRVPVHPDRADRLGRRRALSGRRCSARSRSWSRRCCSAPCSARCPT